jgi:SAM-dependent methyltransferase
VTDDPRQGEAVRARFAATAERVAALQDARAAELERTVCAFAAPRLDERALDVGTGAGALAFALAPHVRAMVGLDLVPELLAAARSRIGERANVAFVEGDAAELPFADAEFDLSGTLRTLHHAARPERILAEMTRVTRPGGRLLVVDQVAPIDPDEARALNEFERARDPSHTRALSDADLRGLFDANTLVLHRSEQHVDRRELGPYLDLAGCIGDARQRALELAPPGYTATYAWYLLVKPAV